MLSSDELYLFKRELARLEEEKQKIPLNHKYKLFLDDQIDLLQDVIRSHEE
ncbi:hypothetical protein [Shouchella patagoniensis]|uniref:hypothetical protein n=1 Tax=Shouchella patagoniensis TaxID=228576 RepID=UPI0014764DEE|nr:hypothetical protein [Shouchella patagoniensis]